MSGADNSNRITTSITPVDPNMDGGDDDGDAGVERGETTLLSLPDEILELVLKCLGCMSMESLLLVPDVCCRLRNVCYTMHAAFELREQEWWRRGDNSSRAAKLRFMLTRFPVS